MKNILLLGKMCLCENKMRELYGWASDTYGGGASQTKLGGNQ